MNNNSSQPSTINKKGVIGYEFESNEALDREIASFIAESEEISPVSVKNLDFNTEKGKDLLVSKRELMTAQAQIKTLQNINQALRDAQPENKVLPDELKIESNRKLAHLLNKFEKIDKFYDKMFSVEQQITEIGIQLLKNKDAHKNKVSLVELEAFKLATRNEFTTLIDFKLDNHKKSFTERLSRIEDRQKELGKECEHIIPSTVFQSYLRRQQNIESQIESISSTLLPGHLVSAQSLVQGKVDKFDVEKLILKYLNEALSKVNFQGASLNPVQLRPPTPPEPVKKQKQKIVQEIESSSEEVPRQKKKKNKKRKRTPSESSESEEEVLKEKISKRHKVVKQKVEEQVDKSSSETPKNIQQNPKTQEIYSEFPKIGVKLDKNYSDKSLKKQSESDRGSLDQIQRSDSNSSINHRPSMSHILNDNQISADKLTNQQPSQTQLKQDQNQEPTVQQTETIKLSNDEFQKFLDQEKIDKKEQTKNNKKLFSLIEEIQKEMKEQERNVYAQNEKLSLQQRIIDNYQGRLNETEVKGFEQDQRINRLQKVSDRLDNITVQFQVQSEKYAERIQILENEVLNQNDGMSKAPMDPHKRQKYLERRLVLSERSILKLEQEVNLYRIEKKNVTDDLSKNIEQLMNFKHEISQKAEFLYKKIQENSKVLVDQIEGILNQLGMVKQTVNTKMSDLSKETQLYHAELARTQEINREMLNIKQQTSRGFVSQEMSRTTNEMASTKQTKQDGSFDPLAYDSVMSSTLNEEEKRWVDPITAARTTTNGRFWQSTDRRQQVSKPYTARVVPPLLVGELQKYSKPRNDESNVMTQDSIHSNDFDKPTTTIQSTRDKIQNLISQNLSVRSKRSYQTIDNELFLKKNHPAQKIQLQKFKGQFK